MRRFKRFLIFQVLLLAIIQFNYQVSFATTVNRDATIYFDRTYIPHDDPVISDGTQLQTSTGTPLSAMSNLERLPQTSVDLEWQLPLIGIFLLLGSYQILKKRGNSNENKSNNYCK